jgi:single-stranded-DNA-specific exonuclease
LKFGGHELAAGLSVSRGELDSFREKINEYARENLQNADMIPTLEADCEIEYSDISLSLAEDLQILEPYGVGNPVPTFVLRGAYVNEITGISQGKHTRLTISGGTSGSVSAMYFSNSPKDLDIYVGDSVDLMFSIDVNEWLGRRSVQLVVKDIQYSKTQSVKFKDERDRYEEIWNGASFTEEENILPSREDFATFYRFINSSVRAGIDILSHRDLSHRLSSLAPLRNFAYTKTKIIIKVLQELNLIGIEELDTEVYRFFIHYTTSKSDLEKSNLLRRIRSQMTK